MDANRTMTTLLAAGEAPNGWIWAMAVGFVAVCIIMMLVVLIQKPKGGGLSGAFGGGAGGGSEGAFIGGRVGDVLTWFTVVCFVAFLVLAMGMTWAITGGGEAPADEDDPTTEQQAGDEGAGAGAAAEDDGKSGDE